MSCRPGAVERIGPEIDDTTASWASELPRSGTHVPALDGLRGLAIALVMLLHFTQEGRLEPTTSVDKLFAQVALLGWAGVDLFFVLSGFLITGILFEAKGSERFFHNFYMRRALRIFPLYYGFLAAWFFLLPRVYTWPSYAASYMHTQAWSWTYLTNVIQALHGDLGAAPTYTGHFWSLAVEEQFYLLWPLAVFFLQRRQLVRLCLACVIVGLLLRVWLSAGGNLIAAYVLTPSRMDALTVGSLLALIGRSSHGLLLLRRLALPVAISSGVVFAITLWFQPAQPLASLLVPGFDHLALAALSGVLILWAVGAGPGTTGHRMFSSPGLRFMGRYSYAMYVFHLPVAYFLGEFAFRVPDVPTIAGSQLPGELLFVGAATAVCVALACTSWHGYEKHFLKLKGRFSYRPAPIRAQHLLGNEPAPSTRALFAPQRSSVPQGSIA
jgi:peptidoglycan/LPS O-acetylase OafA/YrhL